MPLITCRAVFSTMVALAAAGLAAGCAASTSSGPQAAGPSTGAAGTPAASVSAAAAGTGPTPSAAVSSARPAAASPAPSSCASAEASAASAPSGQAAALAAVQFTDGSHGWVAGAGRILATTDAGRSWTRQYSGTAVLDQVDFTDDQHGWAAGRDSLLRTINGGVTWTALTEPCRWGELNSIHFASPTLGYAVAAAAGPVGGGAFTSATGGSLLRTTDGGATWAPVASAPANPQSVCFANSADGYLGTPGHIWRSTDGGQHWTLALTESGSSSNPDTADTPEIECAGPSALWVLFLGHGVAMGHSPYLAYASQDGHEWHGVLEEQMTESDLRPGLKLPEGPGSFPGPFSVIDSGTAAFVGYTPPMGYGAAPVMLASDNGRDLTKEGDVAAINEPLAASFLSQAQGWVVGENLKTNAFDIEATANSGRSWATEYTTG